MKLKMKLTSTVAAFFLILGLVVMGVFALPTVNVSLKGSLTFNATNVSATVSGTVANTKAETQPTLTPLTYKAEYTTEEQTALTNAEKEWEDCDLTFKDDGSAIVITIRITNNAIDRPLYATVNKNSDCNFENVKTTMTNKTETKNYEGEVLTILANANSNINYVDIEISMEVDNKNTSLTKDATYGFNIELNNEKPVVEEPEISTPAEVFTITQWAEKIDGTALIFEPISGQEGEVSVKGAGKDKTFGNITIPEKVKSDDGLIEYTVTTIKGANSGDAGFSSLSGNVGTIENIILSKTIKELPYGAFYECSSLQTIDLSNVTSIGMYAFKGCTALISGSIIVGSKVERIGQFAIPTNACTLVNGVYYLQDYTGANKYLIGTESTEVQSYTVDSNCKVVAEGAFENCSLQTIDLKNVISVGDYAFVSCSSLNIVDFINNTSIGEGAFDGCSSLSNIDISNVTSIGYGAFIGCSSLTTITIGTGITNILAETFYECDEIATINYLGTKTQWETLFANIGDDNGTLKTATVNCSDGVYGE